MSDKDTNNSSKSDTIDSSTNEKGVSAPEQVGQEVVTTNAVYIGPCPQIQSETSSAGFRGTEKLFPSIPLSQNTYNYQSQESGYFASGGSGLETRVGQRSSAAAERLRQMDDQGESENLEDDRVIESGLYDDEESVESGFGGRDLSRSQASNLFLGADAQSQSQPSMRAEDYISSFRSSRMYSPLDEGESDRYSRRQRKGYEMITRLEGQKAQQGQLPPDYDQVVTEQTMSRDTFLQEPIQRSEALEDNRSAVTSLSGRTGGGSQSSVRTAGISRFFNRPASTSSFMGRTGGHSRRFKRGETRSGFFNRARGKTSSSGQIGSESQFSRRTGGKSRIGDSFQFSGRSGTRSFPMRHRSQSWNRMETQGLQSLKSDIPEHAIWKSRDYFERKSISDRQLRSRQMPQQLNRWNVIDSMTRSKNMLRELERRPQLSRLRNRSGTQTLLSGQIGTESQFSRRTGGKSRMGDSLQFLGRTGTRSFPVRHRSQSWNRMETLQGSEPERRAPVARLRNRSGGQTLLSGKLGDESRFSGEKSRTFKRIEGSSRLLSGNQSRSRSPTRSGRQSWNYMQSLQGLERRVNCGTCGTNNYRQQLQPVSEQASWKSRDYFGKVPIPDRPLRSGQPPQQLSRWSDSNYMENNLYLGSRRKALRREHEGRARVARLRNRFGGQTLSSGKTGTESQFSKRIEGNSRIGDSFQFLGRTGTRSSPVRQKRQSWNRMETQQGSERDIPVHAIWKSRNNFERVSIPDRQLQSRQMPQQLNRSKVFSEIIDSKTRRKNMLRELERRPQVTRLRNRSGGQTLSSGQIGSESQFSKRTGKKSRIGDSFQFLGMTGTRSQSPLKHRSQSWNRKESMLGLERDIPVNAIWKSRDYSERVSIPNPQLQSRQMPQQLNRWKVIDSKTRSKNMLRELERRAQVTRLRNRSGGQTLSPGKIGDESRFSGGKSRTFKRIEGSSRLLSGNESRSRSPTRSGRQSWNYMQSLQGLEHQVPQFMNNYRQRLQPVSKQASWKSRDYFERVPIPDQPLRSGQLPQQLSRWNDSNYIKEILDLESRREALSRELERRARAARLRRRQQGVSTTQSSSFGETQQEENRYKQMLSQISDTGTSMSARQSISRVTHYVQIWVQRERVLNMYVKEGMSEEERQNARRRALQVFHAPICTCIDCKAFGVNGGPAIANSSDSGSDLQEYLQLDQMSITDDDSD